MPETEKAIPAAQYLRMSTEHQQYSMENQSTLIEKYAAAHGFEIVRTYHDAAKSGVSLRQRNGLKNLLRDVVAGGFTFRAILVYDVSRWGRFQDTDESAHYEFLCKSAGVPVHYCAEAFANDSSLPNLIMKAIKRTMAGEYSRELGVKVLAGQKRLATMGFKQGGVAGYGLRRMLVSSERAPKQQLAFGEKKSIATDRVILVPGPPHEVACVREIYRMLISEKRSVRAIARELNRRGIPHLGKAPWDYQAVYFILTKEKYVGHHVFGRTSRKLYTPTVRLPRSEWIIKPNAFVPLVTPAMFAQAQKILNDRTIKLSNAEILERLRETLCTKGKLSYTIVKETPGLPSPSAFMHRFGSLRTAYDLVGYGRDAVADATANLRRRVDVIRRSLISNIVTLFPTKLSIVQLNGRWRQKIKVSDGRIISVLIATATRGPQGIKWRIRCVPGETGFITLLARLNPENTSFMDYFILPNVSEERRTHIRMRDPWLLRGRRLDALEDFCAVVQQVASKI